jgi:hypothetical protein
MGEERRKRVIPVAFDRRRNSRGYLPSPGSDTEPSRVYDSEETEFLKAIDNYKRLSGRQFPSWSEALMIFKMLGWRKVAERVPFNGMGK